MGQNTTKLLYGPSIKTYFVYVQKHIVTMGMSYNPELVRDKPLGAPTSVKLVY